MVNGKLNPTIRDYIIQNFDSIELLEILLLVYRSSDRDWSAAEIAERICANPVSALTRLERLLAQGFVEEGTPGRFQFRRTDEGRTQLAENIAQLYSERRYTVIDLIYNRPASILSFADSFNLRKGDPHA